MSQRVPSWDIDDPPPNNPSANLPLYHYHPSGDPLDFRTDYEVAELTWENGQLALHGLVPPRTGKPAPKHPSPSVVATAAAAAGWNKHHRSGTLESVVHQATGAAPTTPDLEDWFGELNRSAAAAAAVDAIVPCQDLDVANNRLLDPNAASGRKCARMAGVCSSQGSAAGSMAGRIDSATLGTHDTYREDELCLTVTTTATAINSASLETENTSLGKRTMLAFDDYSHTSSQTKHDSLYDEEEKVEKPSASAKKSRAASNHNQSERKRRDRINLRIRTLQKLVPNSSKTDKASMLDEVIEYVKKLQAQAQMMSRMNHMMMPIAMPQLQMAMMANMTQLCQQLPQMGMGVGMMDPISIGRSMPATLYPFLHSSTFLPLGTAGAWDASGDRRFGTDPVLPDPFSAFLACQMALQQPMSLDEYSRMAALMFQQLCQHQPQANAKS